MLKIFGFYNRKAIQAGQVFIREGDPGYEAYLIQSGKVLVFRQQDGEKIKLAELGPGNIVGEVALIMDEPRSASVEALEATNVVVVTRDDFRKMMLKTDQTIQSVLKLLSNRLESQNTVTITSHQENMKIDADSELITKSFTRGMNAPRKEKFIRQVGPHMSNLIKALKDFKSST